MSDSSLVAAEVISAFVSHNSIPVSELPALIHAVVGAFDDLNKAPAIEASSPKPIPMVPIRKSVTDEYLISLETGERFQTLRRHLSGLGMTPDQYRKKWGLAADYPMTAKSYSERRSALAKNLGLGRKPAEPAEFAASKGKKARVKPTALVEAEALSPSAEGAQEPAETKAV